MQSALLLIAVSLHWGLTSGRLITGDACLFGSPNTVCLLADVLETFWDHLLPCSQVDKPSLGMPLATRLLYSQQGTLPAPAGERAD